MLCKIKFGSDLFHKLSILSKSLQETKKQQPMALGVSTELYTCDESKRPSAVMQITRFARPFILAQSANPSVGGVITFCPELVRTMRSYRGNCCLFNGWSWPLEVINDQRRLCTGLEASSCFMHREQRDVNERLHYRNLHNDFYQQTQTNCFKCAFSRK